MPAAPTGRSASSASTTSARTRPSSPRPRAGVRRRGSPPSRRRGASSPRRWPAPGRRPWPISGPDRCRVRRAPVGAAAGRQPAALDRARHMLAPRCAACSARVLRDGGRAGERAGAADPARREGRAPRRRRGRAVVLHGVNVVYKLAPYAPDFTRADARRVRGWGMNAIRLGVSWRALEPARGRSTRLRRARARAWCAAPAPRASGC